MLLYDYKRIEVWPETVTLMVQITVAVTTAPVSNQTKRITLYRNNGFNSKSWQTAFTLTPNGFKWIFSFFMQVLLWTEESHDCAPPEQVLKVTLSFMGLNVILHTFSTIAKVMWHSFTSKVRVLLLCVNSSAHTTHIKRLLCICFSFCTGPSCFVKWCLIRSHKQLTESIRAGETAEFVSFASGSDLYLPSCLPFFFFWFPVLIIFISVVFSRLSFCIFACSPTVSNQLPL